MEAAQAAAAAAAAQAAAAAAVSDIPQPGADFATVECFMHRVREDIAAGRLAGWLANDGQRFKAVEAAHSSWLVKCSGTQRILINQFLLAFRTACATVQGI